MDKLLGLGFGRSGFFWEIRTDQLRDQDRPAERDQDRPAERDQDRTA